MTEFDRLVRQVAKALFGKPKRLLKAIVYIIEGRVTVTSANEHGVRYEVAGSRREPYRCAYGEANGKPYRSCTCEGAEFNPLSPKCSHLTIGSLLWRR